MVSNFDLNRTALNNQMMGLSTDTKPTNGIIPNSLFWELDTNGMYYFDGTQWQPIGGSGGDSDFKINNVTFVCDPNTTQSSSPTGGRLAGMIIDEEDNMYYITGAQIIITEETAYKLVSYKNNTYFTIEPEDGITFTNVTVTSGECDVEFDEVYYINAKSDAVITIEWQETA